MQDKGVFLVKLSVLCGFVRKCFLLRKIFFTRSHEEHEGAQRDFPGETKTR